MKLEITRKDFLKSWQLAEKFTGTKTTQEALRGILISASEDGVLRCQDSKGFLY